MFESLSQPTKFTVSPVGCSMNCCIVALLLASAHGATLRQSTVSDQSIELHAAAFAAAVKADLRNEPQSISPNLEPKSDKKFFDKDYPQDKRPVADKYYVFDHPYPAVQDSGDYDKDFIKDENSDGGKWKAQMQYDTLRSKIREATNKLKKLKEAMEKEYKDWMRSKENAKDAGEAADKAAKDLESAKTTSNEAEKKVNELEGRSQKDGTKVGGSIGDAIKKVQDEMDDLENCKKALAEAKRRLKQLLKEKEEFEIKKKAAKEADAKAAEKAAKKAAKEKAEAEAAEKAEAKADAKADAKDAAAKAAAKKKAAEAKEEAAFDDAAWQRKLDREKKDHAEALRNYEKQLKDVKITEDKLARAAANLRKFRRPPYVDNNGGVYYEPKSLAFSAYTPAATILAVLTTLFA